MRRSQVEKQDPKLVAQQARASTGRRAVALQRHSRTGGDEDVAWIHRARRALKAVSRRCCSRCAKAIPRL